MTSEHIAFVEFTYVNKEVVEKRIRMADTTLNLDDQGLLYVENCICQLTRVTALFVSNQHVLAPFAPNLNRGVQLGYNFFETVPPGVLKMNWLSVLILANNRVALIPTGISRLTSLTEMHLQHNLLVHVPREVGQLTTLKLLALDHNQIVQLPRELGNLDQLVEFSINDNLLTWLPMELDRLPETTRINLHQNRFNGPVDARSRQCLGLVFAATTNLGMIRERATEICIGLQDLELPALVTLKILNAALPVNNIRMAAKWNLITAVKHWRR